MDDIEHLFQKAYKEHQNNNLKKAKKQYRKILDTKADHPSALHLLGIIEFDLGNIKDAVLLVGKSVKLAPNEEQWIINYGNILSKAEKKESAAAAFLKVLEINPESLEAKQKLADIYFESGKFAEALKLYYKIFCDHLTDKKIAYKYAETIRAMGKKDDADIFLSWFEKISV